MLCSRFRTHKHLLFGKSTKGPGCKVSKAPVDHVTPQIQVRDRSQWTTCNSCDGSVQ